MPSTESKRPNIIMILTDDQGHWAMGCAGNPELKTPNLDRLAASGIRFDNLFCVTPVCSAARASILTGNIPSCHGVHDFLLSERNFLDGKPGYTDFLADAGYSCGISGKWHMGDDNRAQKSYGYWRVHHGGYVDGRTLYPDGRREPENAYSTHVITDYALDFLDQQTAKTGPFYLTVAYNAPHSPWERSDHPVPTYDDYHKNCAFDSVPYEPMHPDDAGLTDFFSSEQRRRDKLSGYFAAITTMDEGVGRILDWLEANGLREDTLVLFTSDNGMNMGHHGICGKGNGTQPVNMYDSSVKVPGIVSRPGHVPQGIVETGLYSHYDFMPTLLDYTGVSNPAAGERPGRSFAPLLCGRRLDGHDKVVIYDEYGPVRMLRTRSWKYVHRHDGKRANELYDLVNDPHERTNLIDAPGEQARVREMQQQLLSWFECYTVPENDGAKLPVTGCGQFCLPGPADAFAQDWPTDWKRKS